MTPETTRTERPAPAPASAPTRELAVLLSSTRRGARLARLLTVAHLADQGLPTETAAQITAELAGNAVLHGRVPGRDFRLGLRVTGDGGDVGGVTLRIEVSDARGDRLPAAPGPSAPEDAEGGRGLLLVEALADRWGVESWPPPRKTVWAELDLRP
ncbi:ATP-binding protein [Streptomyces verrucosisporus]|uniref:ATP-binding protein n=1 Tax=Streptomyces verrucosisporus TaxID=1695161 RepID=UPI003555EC07